MKTKLSLVLTCLFFTAVQFTYSQKVHVASGDVKPILSEKEINIQYDYAGMKVGKGFTEEEYVNEKVTEYNKKEAGKGDKWKAGWVNARAERYQPKFEELMNKQLEDKGIKHGKFPNSKYTLIVKTTYTEPGYNVGVMKQPSFVDFEFYYVETANPTTIVSKIVLMRVMGAQAMGFDYDAGSRIAESYAKAGKILGKHVASGK